MHKGTSYPGERAAIIDTATWDKVQAVLAANRVARPNGTRAQTPVLLRGLIFAPGGHAMTPSHTRKASKLYRYYVASDAIRQGYAECRVRSMPAAEAEEAVVAQLRHLLRTPEIIARTWAAAKRDGDEAIAERGVVKAITDLAPLWDELFPAWLKLVVAVSFVAPAAIAGFHATHGIIKHLMPSDAWQIAFSIVGAGAVGITAFVRIAGLGASAAEPRPPIASPFSRA